MTTLDLILFLVAGVAYAGGLVAVVALIGNRLGGSVDDV